MINEKDLGSYSKPKSKKKQGCKKTVLIVMQIKKK
jgi:hypothetical protein